LPKLTIAGDIVPEATTRSVMADVSGLKVLKCVIGGVLQTNAKALSVTMQEV